MKLAPFFHFLGGLYFALMLIFGAACFAIAGTFLESLTESHRYAAIFTYGSPLFIALLGGFFLNILISALRRYPFKPRHIPFLITHLGMLMVLAGTFVKTQFGTQGTLTIVEGSASNEIALPDSYALYIESRETASPCYYCFSSNFSPYSPLKRLSSQLQASPYDHLEITLLDYADNSIEKLDTFVKWNHTSIFGMKPHPLQRYDPSIDRLPEGAKVHFPSMKEPVNLLALDVDDAADLSRKAIEIIKDREFVSLLIMRDKEDNVSLCVVTKEGRLISCHDGSGGSERMLSYDDGHLGYSMETTFTGFPEGPLQVEAPIMPRHKILAPLNKLESNIPCVALRFKEGDKEETIALSYTSTGKGFKWPIFNGRYVVRFQPHFKAIPYRLRLRQARQVNYPGTNQPFSYESDLIITESENGKKDESTISMNNVYETSDGYRFYLANISPSDASAIKQVQIVVNRDPAKYLLTYPGALLMTLGIILLFFRRTPKKN